MAQLALTNVITISISQSNPGVGNYNTSNLALFTDEAPANSFGNLGYSSYLTPTQVGIDFGTGSKTFAMANAVFSQQPNILIGGGQLVIILLQVATQSVLFSAAPASGTFVLNYNGNPSAAINFNDTAAQIQGKLQAVPALGNVQVTGSIAANTLVVAANGVYGVALLMTVTANTLNGGITVTPTVVNAGEKIAAAITRTVGLVQYFGIMVNESAGTGQVIPQADVASAAAVVQPLVKLLFVVTNSSTDLIAITGMVAANTLASLTQTRILYYGDTAANGVGVANALNFCAGYAGGALSVDFSGSLTTTTRHLKVISGTVPDPTMTQTILNLAIAAGADCYISLQGVACIFTSGANMFFDRIYNQLWFTGALQVAGFNYLAQTNTKVPQTESGMDGLKGAYRTVCEQAITNGYFAPGSWNSATTFGNPADLILNVGQRGYYIFSTPIARQSQATRVTRAAALVQIAGKEAGAIQSSNVIATINA